MLRPTTLLLALVITTPAVGSVQEAGDLASLLDFAQVDPVVTRAFQWRYSRAHGYLVADEVFAEDSADWPVAKALQDSLRRHLDLLAGSGETATLAGRRRSSIVQATKDGLVLADRQGEHEVSWSAVEGKELATLLRRREGKDGTDQVAIAVLCDLIGDHTNKKRAMREVEGAPAASLEEWLKSSAAVPAEMAAADALEEAWMQTTAATFVSQVERTWPAVAETQVGQGVAMPMAERYQKAAREVLQGEQALAEILHGEWTATPGKDGALHVELTYVFTDDKPLRDLVPGPLPRPLRAAYQFLVSWWEVPEEFSDWAQVEDTAWATGAHLVFLDLPFDQVDDLEVTGTVKADADPTEFLHSFLSFGLYDDKSGHYLATYNQWRLMELGAKGTRPSGHKDVQTAAAAPLVARIRWADSMVILERDGETMSRLAQPEVRGGRFFLAAGGHPLWGVQKVSIQGTVTPATLDQHARRLGEARTQALFGPPER